MSTLKFFAVVALSTAPLITGCNMIRPDVSGVWKGAIVSKDKRGGHWNGKTEMILNQQGSALTGTVQILQPQAGRIQLPISAGVLQDHKITLSGSSQQALGSVELVFTGKEAGEQIIGEAELNLHSLLGSQQEHAELSLTKSGS